MSPPLMIFVTLATSPVSATSFSPRDCQNQSAETSAPSFVSRYSATSSAVLPIALPNVV